MTLDSPRSHTNNQLEQQVRLEEMRLLYGGTPFSYTASFVIVLIIFGVLYNQVISVQNLVIWLALMLTVLLARSIESYRFAICDKHQQQKTAWRTRFFIGTGIAGLSWGLLPWLGYSHNVEYLSFIIICQVGIIAGSLSTLFYRWETLVLFLLPSSFLLILKLISEADSFSNATSFVLFVFIIFSLFAGKRIFNNTQKNIRLRIEADNRERAMELMHQKQALHLQNTPLAIIEFDIDLNISEWNAAAENIFGYSRSVALGENILRLILPRESSADAEKLWQRLLNHEAVVGTVIENKTQKGLPIFCEWFITPLTDNQHNIVGIAAMALDITEKKHSEMLTIKAKEEAEQANRKKSDFLSIMSHELRTPLNAILGFTQLLKYEKDLSKKQQSHIGEIGKAGSLLLVLVNQILDLARIEKGHIQLSMEQVNLHDIFVECHAMVLPLAEQSKLQLNFSAEANSYVIADHTRLKQVMLNLLSNAIKYNVTNGSVNVTAKLLDQNIVQICVADTGKGISEKMLPRVFQAFNRLSGTDNIEGTGIGLSISKQLVKKMNGNICVTSEVDRGSEFCIKLTGGLNTTNTISNTGDDKPREITTEVNPEKPLRCKILVAEDNQTNQTLILNQLKVLGYEADLVKNGQEALEKLLNHHYQLLLTDCNMPIIDGYKLAKTIRQRGDNKLPIIALTADAFPARKAQCLKAGINEYITKPVDLNTLKDTIKKHLKGN